MHRPLPPHPPVIVCGRRRRGSTRLHSPRVFAAVALLALAGCASLVGPGEPPVDTVWRVVELDGRPVPRLHANRAPTLLLDAAAARASGFAGCNRMTGRYTIDGDAISFGPLASTRMACGPPADEVETRYFEALEAVVGWRVRDEALELLDAEGSVLARLERTGRIDPPLPGD